MDGLVTVLPKPYDEYVEKIWDRLEETCGLNGIRVTPYPHFSWHIAENYDLEGMKGALGQLACRTKPFKVQIASGLSLFTGSSPVLYLPVFRSPELIAFHQQVWDICFSFGNVLSPYYAPPMWIPHISLAYADLTVETIGEAIRQLAFTPYTWEFEVNNLTFIEEPTGTIGKIRHQVFFEG